MGSGQGFLKRNDRFEGNQYANKLFPCYFQVIAIYSHVINKYVPSYSHPITNLFLSYLWRFSKLLASYWQVIGNLLANNWQVIAQ